MPHTMYHPRLVRPSERLHFFTTSPELVQELGGEGPHEAAVVRLEDRQAVTLEVDTGKPWRITIDGVPAALIDGAGAPQYPIIEPVEGEPYTADRRWQWPPAAPIVPAGAE